ncbi:hypothetical protein ACAF98_24575, partial [Escherichia coli]|uniref:hypothetical protein n=1 Tax=Escherichia coli TaxID=562 RepID=UPI003FA12C3E
MSLILILLMVSMGIPGFSYAESERLEATEKGIVETVNETTDETVEEDLSGTGKKTMGDVTDLITPDDESGRPDSENDPDN